MTDPDPADPYAPPPEGGRPRGADPRRGPGPGSGSPPERPPGYGPPPPYGGTPRPLPPPPGPPLKSGRRALGLALAGVILMIPLLPVGLVLAVAGLVQGIRALREAGRRSAPVPGGVAAVVLGAVGSALGLGLLAAALFLLPELRDYRQCMSGANTEIARTQCWSQFEVAYQRKLGVVPR